MLWQSIIDMHHPKYGTVEQGVLKLHFQKIITELLVVLASAQLAEAIKMKRQQLAKDGVGFTQNSFVQKAQHPNITAKDWRSKVKLQERCCFFKAYFVPKTPLDVIQSF